MSKLILRTFGLWAYSLLVLFGPPLIQAQGPTDNTDQAQICWQRSYVQQLPNLNTNFTHSKKFDCGSGRLFVEVVDENGEVVEVSDLLKLEEAARLSNPLAKIDPRLWEAIEEDPGKLRTVVAWLTFDETRLGGFAAELLDPLSRGVGDVPAFSEQEATGIESAILEFNLSQVSAVIDNIRQLLGNQIIASSTTAPVVGLLATGEDVVELAEMPEIDTFYLEEGGVLLNQDALVAHRVLAEWPDSRFGLGRRIAILEDEEIQESPLMRVADYLSPPASFIDHGHATAVASTIGSLFLPRLGSAFGAQLFSANSGSLNDLDVFRATDWVMRTRIDVTNISWGGLVADGTIRFRDRWFDFHSRYNLATIVAAGGNDGSEFVHSPALAWNVIAVGNIDTGSSRRSWADDRMNPNSAWRFPLNGNRKPNVAARGTDVRTLGLRRTRYIPPRLQSGTSIASPFVAAAVALAMNQNPTLLPAPETAMATIVATAWNRVDYPELGGSSQRPSQDGIHSSAASRAAGDFRTIYQYITPSRLNDLGYSDVEVELEAGNRTRIAVAWSAAARSYVHVLGYLQSDFDVLVFEGNGLTGPIVAFSVSDFSNVELLEFTPRTSGAHTIAIYAPRLSSREPERVGIAISTADEDLLGSGGG